MTGVAVRGRDVEVGFKRQLPTRRGAPRPSSYAARALTGPNEMEASRDTREPFHLTRSLAVPASEPE